jgi:predicted Fe-Mo cluster-binding NifX family protein
MNICIPITEDKGLQSPLSPHFGSAPMFMIVDTVSGSCRAILNHNSHHGHGMCQPLASLAGEKLDGMVVGGIGMGALDKLEGRGIQAFLAEHPTVAETIEAFKAGRLRRVTPKTACAGHGRGRKLE